MPSIFLIQYSVSLGSTSQYGSENSRKLPIHTDFKIIFQIIKLFIKITFYIIFSQEPYIFLPKYIFIKYIYISGGPLSALTCCVNARLLSAIKKYRR